MNMNMPTDPKTVLTLEVAAIIEMLTEVKTRLDALPRTTTASRQLQVITSKLDTWRRMHSPQEALKAVEESREESTVPSHEEIDRVLKAYRRNGFFGLSDRDKYVISYFDKHYLNKTS